MVEQFNPFAGLKRKRLPGMHLITACEGGMPLHDALAAFFFMMLHNQVEHNCLVKKALEEHAELVHQAVHNAKSPDGAALSNIFGIMGFSSFAFEEWSYLDDEDTFTFYLIANTAVEQVQRWIAEGSHKPFTLPALGGEIVQRPQWAIDCFGTPDSPKRAQSREYVKKLLAEIDENKASNQPATE